MVKILYNIKRTINKEMTILARAIKKVKTTEKNKFTKKFWIILSSTIILLAGISVGVGLAIHFNQKDDTIKDTYFTDLKDIKINYSDVDSKIDNVENLFIFVYDGSTFDTDENESDVEIEKHVRDLKAAIDERNQDLEHNVVELYIINTYLTGNSNVLSNYGLDVAPGLIYIKGDKQTTTVTVGDEEYTVNGGGTAKKVIAILKQAIIYAKTITE